MWLSTGASPETASFTDVRGGTYSRWQIFDRTNHLRHDRPEGGSILYVEDDRDSRRLGNALLRKAGYEVDVAADGQTGYEMAMEALTQGESYDVVLMDMQMPVLDGYEATRHLRRDGYPGIIVALTAHAMAGDRERCEESGCDDYLTKPIDREALFSLIARHVAARSS